MIAGRYSLRHEIGRGGMGIVWLAEDEILGREVAMKRIGLTPGGTSADLARAAREARLAATLNHPNVVAVFDLVPHGDEQWLVMEYVEGVTLAQLVREKGTLSPDSAARLLCQAADGLAAAHRAGIVHRDVKPSNILVMPSGRVKLTDFGIARGHADATLTQTGMMTGSPAYLAPELASGGTASPASDVWALGATLFHALEGRPPYDTTGNVMGALFQIVNEEPPRPQHAGWLSPLLEVTMARRAEERWPMSRVADFLASGKPDSGEPASTAAAGFEPGPEEEHPTAVLEVPAAGPGGSSLSQGQQPPPPPPSPSSAPSSARSSARGSAAPESAASGGGDRRGAGRAAALLMAAVAVVALLTIGWTLLDDGEGTDQRAGQGTAQDAGQDTSEDAGQGAGQDGGEEGGQPEQPAPTPTPTAEAMEAFVADYLATVTTAPAAAWDRLTPGFQRESGGFDSYRGWWSTVDSASLQDVEADPGSMTVSYTVTYQMADGTTSTDEVTLDLTMAGDAYLIQGES